MEDRHGGARRREGGMQHAGRELGGAGSSAGGSHDTDPPELGVGMRRGVYERAFGALGDLGMDRTRLPAPWPQHGDLLDEHEHEELLYRRQMALAAQDRARYASYTAQMGGGSKPYHRMPSDYAMHPMHGSHHQAMMAHAAASRRAMTEMACAQADMAHRRGYPFDIPYPAANRRMMFPPFHGGDGWGASEEELAHYGMGIGAHAGAMCNGRPAQAIDIDFGGMKGRRGNLNAGKQPPVKRELVIFPRRKAGQDKRQADNEAPVKLTPEILDKISDIPLVAAAKKLGISKTALKNACRHLGLKRWPFRRRREDARRNALMKGSSSSSSATRSRTSPGATSNSNSTDGNCDKHSPPRDSGDEDDDSDASEDDDDDDLSDSHVSSTLKVSSPSVAESASRTARGTHDHKSATTSLREALACILPSGSAETKDYKGLDGAATAGDKSDGAAKVMGMLEGGQTPPAPLQALSRAGSQDEDDLFNLGCNHSASEMWTSLSETREYQLHVPHDDPREQAWPMDMYGLPARELHKMAPPHDTARGNVLGFLVADSNEADTHAGAA